MPSLPGPDRGFPRTRGDVPYVVYARQVTAKLPPHTRGCTHRLPGRPEKFLASPAHAGMYLRQVEADRRRRGFPRTRGDVPYELMEVARVYGLPPHTRGCTERRELSRNAFTASPAHAGMYPLARSGPPTSLGFPRTRGDVPGSPCAGGGAAGLPPHTRGCTATGVVCRLSPDASPAHAGMYLVLKAMRAPVSGFPRTRGDVPWVELPIYRLTTLPPHTRGCTLFRAPSPLRLSASPAHAGMYRSRPVVALGDRRFPRTRGDVPWTADRAKCGTVLPPHTRGCTRPGAGDDRPADASPAHAGMYPAPGGRATTATRFPRTRGDVPFTGASSDQSGALPPHTRGCT